jgi:hypothetical protein
MIRLVLAAVAALALIAAPASAQQRRPQPAPESRQTPPPEQGIKTVRKLSIVQALNNPIAVLQALSVADLQAALDDAKAQTPPTTISINCWTALLALAQSPTVNPLPTQPGIFLAIQKALDAKQLLANIQSPNGPLASLNIACAPLVLDGENTLIQLGIIAGVVSGTAITGLPIPLP